jgi:hypothetical protein
MGEMMLERCRSLPPIGMGAMGNSGIGIDALPTERVTGSGSSATVREGPHDGDRAAPGYLHPVESSPSRLMAWPRHRRESSKNSASRLPQHACETGPQLPVRTPETTAGAREK